MLVCSVVNGMLLRRGEMLVCCFGDRFAFAKLAVTPRRSVGMLHCISFRLCEMGCYA